MRKTADASVCRIQTHTFFASLTIDARASVSDCPMPVALARSSKFASTRVADVLGEKIPRHARLRRPWVPRKKK
jgi:hypothetical protein